MIFYAKNNIPTEGWKKYRKTTLTQAIKINEPFMVKTLEGDMFCADGYLAMDVQENPYPIETKIFNESYVEIKEEDSGGIGASVGEEARNEVIERITEYLAVGGLWNPAYMEHEKVRNLLIDARTEVDRLQEALKVKL